jgi:polysaccharide export outer membrane protein
LILIFLAVALTSCAQLPDAPSKVQDKAEFVYEIGPGDKLNVNVWRNPELSSEATVSPDGNITTPLVENLRAIGKTPESLAREIESVLRKFIREPTVTVLVLDYVDSRNQVRVVGQAAKPASIPFRQGMTLLDVMIKVGGLTEFAAGNRAVLIRQSVKTGAKKTDQYRVRLRDLLKGGDVSANVEVLPGDVIMIPEGVL